MQEHYDIDFLPQTKQINYIEAENLVNKYLKQIEFLQTHSILETAYQTFKGV